jgi:hypothetical protein
VRTAVYIFCILIAVACEGNKYGSGIVYDQQANIPLDSVKYETLHDNEIKYTDSLGKYDASGPFGGCLSDCPDYKVEFSKSGYKTKRVVNADKDIFLEQE